MTDFLSFLGFLLGLAFAVVGARTIWGWLASGYALESRQLALGRGCLKVADEVLEDVKVPVLRPRIVKEV